MNKFGLSFHHFGLAIKDPAYASKFLLGLEYRIGEIIYDPAQNVNLIMCDHSLHPSVEIIYPGKGPGPIDEMVQRHSSGIVYHVCYEASDLEATLAGLVEAGLRADCVAPPTPAPLFEGRKVSFYRIKGMGLIEILE